MTAICGRWNSDGSDASAMVRRFAHVAKRYGRERWRARTDGPASLGKTLYPLLPEDAFPDSLDEPTLPAALLPGRWIVAADIRLTERDDLASQLGIDADRLSDSSLAAAALEQWGEAAFERIYGVFAIIAWDCRERRLVLARDALGERPLFYHTNADGCSAASMPDILLADPVVPARPDEEQYRQFLRMNAFAPGRCAFEAIRTVRPGHFVTICAAGERHTAWWRPDLTPLQLRSQADYEALMDDALGNAVRSCLRRRTGRIGAHLSSGFDSTAVAATAARLLATMDERMTAFVAVPREGPLRTMADRHLADESELAGRTAAMHGNMELVRITPTTGPLTSLGRARSIYPAPVSNLCNLPWFEAINDRARDHGVSVLLHGAVGNTSISESGVWALRESARKMQLRTWFQIARGLVRNGWMRWRGVLFNTIEDGLPDRLWRCAMTMTGQTIEDERDMTLLSRPAYAAAAQAHRRAAAQAGAPLPDTGEIDRERGLSSVEFRLQALRTNGDGDQYKAMLGEWGLDLRDPTADRRLVELALRIPVERLIWNGEPRAILRRVLADRAPPEVLDNRRRGYQAADWAQAICQDREAFVDELERLEMYEPTAAFLDVPRIHRLIAEMPDTASPAWDSDEAENGYRLACLRTISAASHMRAIARSNI